MKIDMLGIFTDQFDAMKSFYVSVLEFEIGPEQEKYVEFSGQGVRFALCERSVMAESVSAEHFGERATGRSFSLAFRCDSESSLETDLAELLAKGAELVREPSVMPWGQYTAFFADPDGHVHELFVDLPTG